MVTAVDSSGFRNSSPATELQRISFSIQYSAPKSRWTAKWTSLSMVSKFGSRPRIPAVNASLRAKLSGIVLKLGLAVKISVGKGSVAPTVKYFGMFKARKVCFKLMGCFKKMKGKAFLRGGSGSGGGVSHRDVGSVQKRKFNEITKEEQQKVPFDQSSLELATWVSTKCHYWQGQVTALLGWVENLSMLFHIFASEMERWATVARAGIVFSTLLVIMLSQLGIAVAMSSAAFLAPASAVVFRSVLNFCKGTSSLMYPENRGRSL